MRALTFPRPRRKNQKVSRFGQYEGFTEPIFDGSKRSSSYLQLDDGTRLAYDLILPALGEAPSAGPLPVLFMYTPYLRTIRAFDDDGRDVLSPLLGFSVPMQVALRLRYWIGTDGDRIDPLFRTRWLRRLVAHGYAVVVVERPGTGASFGTSRQSMEAVAAECGQILDWIAAQEWSDGTIGMFGASQEAWSQFAAASSGSPHLKAIFPAASQLELYDSLPYRGGVANNAFNRFFGDVVPKLAELAVPVDDDPDGRLLALARQEREGSVDAATMAASLFEFPYRDSPLPDGQPLWELLSLYPLIDRINEAGVPVAMTTGWYDIFLGDMFAWFHNLDGPKRLTVRPVAHNGVDASRRDLDHGAEAHRWFDHWLKHVDNGVMGESPIHYYLLGDGTGNRWHTADRWPPPGLEQTPYYCGKGRTGSVASVNDGLLATEGSAVEASDWYRVDYTTTTGTSSRWVAIDSDHEYPNLASNDAKGLTYTTLPLDTDVVVAGHPVARLWLQTGAPDLDVFVYLEDVDGRDRSTYVTEGTLRASHRSLAPAPFANLALPFHTHHESDCEPIPPEEPVELVVSLLPTAYRFEEGNRIRLAITFTDADNFATPILQPPPSVRVLRGPEHPTVVQLPIVDRSTT
ncbi:MAG: CocE/NonD family hydrolase [Acidimicrobiia bacterium]|nr:CocE/NonD family hydrolase [Acidimicrobiia bacterium]